MTSQIRREPTRRNKDSRRARTMRVQQADELSYRLSDAIKRPTLLIQNAYLLRSERSNGGTSG